jgi:hypothetical protein
MAVACITCLTITASDQCHWWAWPTDASWQPFSCLLACQLLGKMCSLSDKTSGSMLHFDGSGNQFVTICTVNCTVGASTDPLMTVIMTAVFLPAGELPAPTCQGDS